MFSRTDEQARAQAGRATSRPGDDTEKEAGRAAHHAARFESGMQPFLVQAQPTAQVHFQRVGESAEGDAEAREELGREPAIMAELVRSVARTNAQGLQDRKRALIQLFRAVSRQERPTLRNRLSRPAKDDALARAFRRRLAPPTQRALLAALSGEPIPLPGATDSVLFSAFGAPANKLRLVSEPSAVSIDSAWVRSQVVGVTPSSRFGPPADGSPVSVQWSVTVSMQTASARLLRKASNRGQQRSPIARTFSSRHRFPALTISSSTWSRTALSEEPNAPPSKSRAPNRPTSRQF